MAQPEPPQFSVHLGGGLYMDSNGVLSNGPEPGKPVYPAAGGLPVNVNAIATAFQGMAKALPDKDEPKSRAKFDDILDGINMSPEDKENLIRVLQGMGKVASVIGTVVPIVGAVLAVLTALLGLFKGPTELELLINRRFDELDKRVKAIEAQIARNDLREQRNVISRALDALANYVRELQTSAPDQAQLLLRRQDVRTQVKDSGDAVRNLIDTGTWVTTVETKEYTKVWPWIQNRLFTFPVSGAPQRAKFPAQADPVFDHRLMVPLVIFGVTGFLTVLRASAPEFRSTGENRDDLWTFAKGLDTLAQNMRREGLARTVYTPADFQGGGIPWGLAPEEVIDIPGLSPSLAPWSTRFAVGAMDLRAHDDAYFTTGFTASSIQLPGPQFARQGLLNVRWIPPARLERYQVQVPSPLGWEQPNQPMRTQARYRISNPEECASAANAQAEKDYVDLLYSTGYLNLIHLIATVRNEATDPDHSQTVRSAAWPLRKPGTSARVTVASEPILLTGVVTSPAERQQQQFKATVFFTTQPLGRDRSLHYRVFLRTLNTSVFRTDSPGDDYRSYHQVGYVDDPAHPGFKRLFTSTGQALDSFLLPIQGTTSVPDTREVSGTAKFKANTFDWWVPVKPPAVKSPGAKPLGGAQIGSDTRITKSSLRAAGWEEAAAGWLPPSLETRGGGLSPFDDPRAAGIADFDAVRDQTHWSELVGWQEDAEPAEGQRRSVKQQEVHLDFAVHWKADRLVLSLNNNRPAEDRNYVVYAVIEETLSSGIVLHTVERVLVTGQLTFVPQSFFDEEAAAKEKVARIFSEFARRYAISRETPIPGPEPGRPGLDRQLIATDPVLRQLHLTGGSEQKDLRTLAAVAAQHPPAAAVLRQIMSEAEVAVKDWPEGISESGAKSARSEE